MKSDIIKEIAMYIIEIIEAIRTAHQIVKYGASSPTLFGCKKSPFVPLLNNCYKLHKEKQIIQISKLSTFLSNL